MRIEIKKFREESVSLSAVIKDMRKRAMNKKKALTTMAACGLVAALGVGGTMAYLTDSEQTTNTFHHRQSKNRCAGAGLGYNR